MKKKKAEKQLFNSNNILKRIINSIIDFIKKNIFFVILLVIILLWFLPFDIFNNILDIDEYSTISNILTTLIGSLASILGIILAIFLVSYQVLRHNYSYHALHKLFETKELKFLFHLFICTILTSLFTVLTLKIATLFTSYNLFYFSIILFVFCLLALFPTLRNFLDITRSNRNLLKMILSITYSDIHDFSSYYKKNIISDKIEKNPIYILYEIAISSITNSDLITLKLILSEMINKFTEIIELKKENYGRREMVSAFNFITDNIAMQAIKSSSESILARIMFQIKDMHLVFVKNKFSSIDLIEINSSIRDIFLKTIENKMGNNTEHNYLILKDILVNHLKNYVPKEKKLSISSNTIEKEKNKKEFLDNNIDFEWNYISNDYINTFYYCIVKAIEFKNEYIAIYGIYMLGNLVMHIKDIDQIGNLEKKELFSKCYYNIRILLLACRDQDLLPRGELLVSLTFNNAVISDILLKNNEYSKIPLLEFCSTLIALSRKKFFDAFLIKGLGTIGLSIVKQINENKFFLEALLLICNSLRLIALEIKRTGIQFEYKVYHEIYNQLNSIDNVIRKDQFGNQILKDKLFKILKTFDDFEIRKNIKKNENIVKWPNL
jgi:hypothetical protein